MLTVSGRPEYDARLKLAKNRSVTDHGVPSGEMESERHSSHKDVTYHVQHLAADKECK